MPKGMRWVGLDVHAHATVAAVFDDETGEVVTRGLPGRPQEAVAFLRELEPPMRAVYEAGPTGYGLVRRARAEGIDLAVCAPGRSERRPGDRVKTDKRDAIRLARRLAAGELTLVSVPALEQEQLRDLVRCREDIRADLMRARHRLGKFLLRRERYFPGPGSAWMTAHRTWLARQAFADRASQLTLEDYLHAHDVLLARRDRIESELDALAAASAWAPPIGRLRCLRGIGTLSALGLCAEIGDWGRFEHPDQLASYLGLVPSEHSSGERRRQGAITKAGSTHARRLLIEAAHHYRRQPAVSDTLARRQRGHSARVIDLAWRIQRRLHARWRLLRDGRGKPTGIVAVAVARELAHGCWEIALTD
jgi:transposase